MLESSSRFINRLTGWQIALLLPVWVLLSFVAAQAITYWVLRLLLFIGIPLDAMNGAALTVIQVACVYMLALAIAIGVPWKARRQTPSLSLIGLQRLLSWRDLAFALIAYGAYMVAAIALLNVFQLFPWFDAHQPQDVGFSGLGSSYEYLLAFLTLVIMAPVAEETLFRGYLYGSLRKKAIPFWAAALVTSILFGLVHGSWNAGVDTFTLSMVLCVLREVTGSIWGGIVVHMIKNAIAFYFIFISQSLNGIM